MRIHPEMLIVAMLFLAASCGKGFIENHGRGPEGPIGPKGDTGSQGPQGIQGAPGEDCTVDPVPASSVAPNGGSLISCPDGSQSLVLNGSNGANGTNGSPGTVVAPVQFCPGTPHYPTTFPEVGFCVDHQIYAVYSANGGFLTEVTPGYWSSNAIGSSCNFTVSTDCQISH